MYHDAIVDEAPSVPCRFQVWVLFSAGHPDVPHLLPGLVELHVHRVHTGVVRSHRVAHARGDAVLLQHTGVDRVRDTQKKTMELSKAFILHTVALQKQNCGWIEVILLDYVPLLLHGVDLPPVPLHIASYLSGSFSR